MTERHDPIGPAPHREERLEPPRTSAIGASRHRRGTGPPRGRNTMSIETIVIVVVIVLIVLFVLGYFGRGRRA
jgi:hypothetical protein